MARKDLIQHRRDTAANWTSVNPVLAASEMGFETDTGKFKLGDGTTAWTSLAYQNYTLPTASASVLGGVKVGTGLAIDGSGVLSASGGGGGASLSVANTWTAAQTFNPTTAASPVTIKQGTVVTPLTAVYTFYNKGNGNYYFSIGSTLPTGLATAVTYTMVLTGSNVPSDIRTAFSSSFSYDLANYGGYYVSLYYPGSPTSFSTTGVNLNIYSPANLLQVNNYAGTSLATIDSNGILSTKGLSSAGSISVTGNITATGTIAANQLNLLTSVASANPNTNKVAYMPQAADVAATANAWNSINFLNGANITINGTSALGGAAWMLHGNIVVQTQATNTAAKVTVKIWQTNSSGAFFAEGIASSEVTIPAISGVQGVATIPINGLIRSKGSFQSALISFDVYSTAAITVKRYPPDNATNDSYGYNSTSGDGTSFTFLKVLG